MLDDLHFNMQTVGMILQTLWSGIQDIDAIEDSVRLQIETLANKKKGIEKEKKKPRKRLRLREISEVPRIIRNESDLKNALDGIENAVKEILGADKEVELD